jgi:hypothetical protein
MKDISTIEVVFVGYNFPVETARTGFLGVSSFRLTAYAAVLVLVGVVGWGMGGAQSPKTSPQVQTAALAGGSGTSSDSLAELASSTADTLPEGVTPLGASILAQAVVAFDKATQQASSSAAGVAAVQSFGAEVKPPVDYRTYAASDITTVQDTSKDRVLSYRADLRTALEPLLENKEYELDIFANYVNTKDPQYLDELRAASANYKLAIANTEKVVAPDDAASYQASILTAMSEFSSVLDALVDNASDPFASSALMRTYLDAQDNMVASFNSVGKYASQKVL